MSETDKPEEASCCKNCNYWEELADYIGLCLNEYGEHFDHFTIKRDYCPNWEKMG